MRIWLDAQLSPALATWMTETFDVEDVRAVQSDPQLLRAKDREIFAMARHAGTAVMTKDRDFVDLVAQQGPPPQIIWVTCGNTSNQEMRRILAAALPSALALLVEGQPLVEISGRS